MQARSQRYVRRARAWYGGDPDPAGAIGGSPGAGGSQSDATPRGRRARADFGKHLEATCDRIGFTAEDEAQIRATRALLADHIDDVADEIYREMLAQPEMAEQFLDAKGAVDRKRVAMRIDTFKDWLVSLIGDPLDAATGAYLASVGHAHVRPRDGAEKAIKARQLVSIISRVQTLFIAILAGAISDPVVLGACAAAWCKRLTIHLDVFLAVYGSAESSAHWY